jgi:hypothetical protein
MKYAVEIHTEFHKDRCRFLKVVREGCIHTHAHRKAIS